MNRFCWKNRTSFGGDSKVSNIWYKTISPNFLYSGILLILWYFCTWFVGAHLLQLEKSTGLYEKSLFINEINSTASLYDILASNTSKAKVFIFYSSYCPYCHLSSFTLKKVAESLHQTGLKFYSFECEINYVECSLWSVKEYPTLRLIPPEHKKVDLKAILSYEEYPSIGCTRKHEKNLKFPEKFQPGDVDIPQIIQGTSTAVAMPILNSEKFMICSLIRAFNLQDIYKPLPSIMLTALPPATLTTISSTEPLGRWSEESLKVDPSLLVRDAITSKLYILSRWVFIESKFSNIDQPLDRKRILALYRFVQTSMILLPSRQARKSLTKILEFIDMNTGISSDIFNVTTDNNKKELESTKDINGKGLTFRKWNSFIKSISVGGIGPFVSNIEPTYYLCKRSVFCGVWILFHIWTVAVLHGAKTQINTKNHYLGPAITPQQVLNSIKETVDNFFICKSCRDHFISMFEHNECDRLILVPPENIDNYPIKIEDATGLVFWLFRVHNAITTRVAIESTYRSIEQKQFEAVSYIGVEVSFPPRGLCPTCYKPNTVPFVITNSILGNINDLSTSDYDNNVYDQKNVVRFLEDYYWDNRWILPMEIVDNILIQSSSTFNIDVIHEPLNISSEEVSSKVHSSIGSVFDIFPILYPIITLFIFGITLFYIIEIGQVVENDNIPSKI
ncbi:uncharacterized protein CMU_007380 [Cryptosporidium muris RN66]|uniref:Sulfhydryl oxidase n=1 Tax=Cryptosporidium muris (strain RN66) TaxID=441375 RepID=B6ADF7_CRYMR|nr:uncharacterized protein CMU_007380 [Cryptosporidium muris RN66]EEA06248.1 hypothetical protein, conserved [Cryptosporidium muris RN66]|eukprot:XP_002140597.1 hypothetical protein [Cryptosporidium muris RN66]